jgi:alcohol dehydrogenase
MSANHQVCNSQFQPGFTRWGSFAEFVAFDYADINLVRLPDELDDGAAAGLGCRFVTSFRAVVAQVDSLPCAEIVSSESKMNKYSFY